MIFRYHNGQGNKMVLRYINCTVSVLVILLEILSARAGSWNCTFESGDCGITQLGNAINPHWTVRTATSGSKYYRAIINKISDRSGTYATFNLPSVSYPSSRSGILSFRFFYYTNDPSPLYGSLRVTACEGEDPIFSEGDLPRQWYFRQVPFTCASSVKISFTAIRGSNPTTIGVDDISLTEIRHTTTGSGGSNGAVAPAVSSVLCVIGICLVVTCYVFWRKRRGTNKTDDKEPGNNDDLYINPIYSSQDTTHFKHDLLTRPPVGTHPQETNKAQEDTEECVEYEGYVGQGSPLHRCPSSDIDLSRYSNKRDHSSQEGRLDVGIAADEENEQSSDDLERVTESPFYENYTASETTYEAKGAPMYYSYEGGNSGQGQNSATENGRIEDFEPLYSEEVYGDFQ
ncbi:uncharacterized protein LOC129279940 isoform X2 [Lytechinus pictus]|uniref:uncharacterized protein LOC129279940 isoform X2 n=1 Tax=Lytechinus pictus TaxID=7653 RepID=UPI0030BA061D